MNLQENIHRIKQVMGLKEINLGPSKYTPSKVRVSTKPMMSTLPSLQKYNIYIK
jgi:hypothetical protein